MAFKKGLNYKVHRYRHQKKSQNHTKKLHLIVLEAFHQTLALQNLTGTNKTPHGQNTTGSRLQGKFVFQEFKKKGKKKHEHMFT